MKRKSSKRRAYLDSLTTDQLLKNLAKRYLNVYLRREPGSSIERPEWRLQAWNYWEVNQGADVIEGRDASPRNAVFQAYMQIPEVQAAACRTCNDTTVPGALAGQRVALEGIGMCPDCC